MSMTQNGDTTITAPPGYRRRERPSGDPYWVHETTGLVVDLMRYCHPTQMEDARRASFDHYQYRLTIRPEGRGSIGKEVRTTRDDDYAEEMAREWMREHPDGTVEWAVEADR